MTSTDNNLRDLNKLVDDLYLFKSRYFIGKDVQTLTESRDDAVNKKLGETLSEITKISKDIKGSRSETVAICYNRGKALNIKPEYDEESFECLSKCIKLNPLSSVSWQQLADAYWKKGDLDAAKNCLEESIKIDGKNKEATRGLSILLRQLPAKNTQERFDHLTKSLEKAKAAVEMDMTDGNSWTILGNAYLTLYCLSGAEKSHSSLLKQAKVSYTRGRQDEVESNQPDFLYNYSNLLQFEEEYQEALECLKRAHLMDPKWVEPLERRQSIIKSLRDVYQMVQKKSSLKPKRLQSLVTDLKASRQKMMGPFESEPELKSKYSLKTIRELSPGENKYTIVHLKVIGCIQHPKSICLTVVCIDENSDAVSLSIYNLGKEPKISDSIVIPDPIFKTVSVETSESSEGKDQPVVISYPNIRIENAQRLVVNGKLLPTQVLAKPRVDNLRSND